MIETPVLEWINKKLSEIKDTVLYGKYFDTTLIENVVDEYFLFNRQLGINLVLRKDYSVQAIHLFSEKTKVKMLINI